MSVVKKIRLPLGILCIGVLAVLAINFLDPTPTPDENKLAEPPITEVKVALATRREVSLSASSQGTVEPKRSIDLVAQVSGEIIAVKPGFESGAFFKKDSVLIEIDPRDYEAAFLNAKARLSQAQRVLAEEEGLSNQAQREWRDLGNDKANDLFLRKPQLAEAKAARQAAQASLQIAELNLERTLIRAPFDGRVSSTLVNLGQYVTQGTPVATVYDIAAAEVRLPLSDLQLSLLDLPIGFESTDAEPEVLLSATIAGRQHQWKGVVKRTDASVDRSSRMYYAIVEIPTPFVVSEKSRMPLMPGLFVTAEIAGKRLDDVIELPGDALVQRSYIYTLDQYDTVVMTKANVLKKEIDKVWIQADIPEETRIVLDKHAFISPGTTVSPSQIAENESVVSTALDEES